MSTIRMTHPLSAPPAGRPHRTGFVRAAVRKLSDRVHAATDARAQALGWEITETLGRFGLTGRSYHDPRFAARPQHDPCRASGEGRAQ